MSIVMVASLSIVPSVQNTVPLDSPHEPTLDVAETNTTPTGVDR
jgi:hypothetical protein